MTFLTGTPVTKRQVKLFHFSKIPTHQGLFGRYFKANAFFPTPSTVYPSYSPIWLKYPPSPTFPTFHRCYQNPSFNRQRFDFQFFDIRTYASLEGGGGAKGVDLSSVVSNQFVFETGEGVERRQSWKTGQWHQTLISTWPVKLRTVPFGAL